MYFTGSFLALPRIPSFEEAQHLYKNIKPIRGRSPEVRPLGGRRAADKFSIVQRGDAYVCLLYGHPVLTYKRNEHGTVVEIDLCKHNTRTTRAFIKRITNLNCYSISRKTFLDVGNKSYYLPLDYTMLVQNGKVLNPATATKRVLNREVTAELREKYKEEMAAAAALMLLGRPSISDLYTRFWEYKKEFVIDLTSEEMADYLCLTSWIGVSENRFDGSTKPQDLIRRSLYKIMQMEGVDIYKELDIV